MSGEGADAVLRRLRRVLESGIAEGELQALLDAVSEGDLEEVLGAASRAYASDPGPKTRQRLAALLGSAPDPLVERFEATLEPPPPRSSASEARIPSPAGPPWPSLDPADPELLVAGGVAFGEEGRLELALRWFERALAGDPSHVRARALRAWTRWLLTVDPAWEAEMRALAAEHPDDATIAELLREMG